MLVNGKLLAGTKEQQLRGQLSQVPPKRVCFVVLSENPAIQQFVEMKSRVADRIGVATEIKKGVDIETAREALDFIATLTFSDYDGVVLQLPLPQTIADPQTILDAIPTAQDVDVLSTLSKKEYRAGTNPRVPPVANAVQNILAELSINLANKKILIAGYGRLVGEPVCLMFERMNIPFDVIDIHTPADKKAELFKKADIIISGMGIPHTIKPEMVKAGVILIDAGTSEQAGKLVGDIDPTCEQKAYALTPVPGGVGPLTVISLFENLLRR